MGCYVNPPNETKEDFLLRCGEPVQGILKWKNVPKGFLPVMLINNGPFTAAGIAYCEEELHAFTRPDDLRPKLLFLVKIEDLYAVSPVKEYLEREAGR